MNSKMIKYTLLVLCFAFVLGAVLMSGIINGQKSISDAHIIIMENQDYDIKEITINVGESIEFKAVDDYYWPASNIHPSHAIYPEFDPKKPVEEGKSWIFTFNKPGNWRFHDHINPLIKGVIHVK